MIEFKEKLACEISKVIFEKYAFSLDKAEILLLFEYPPDDSMGDIAMPCFKLSKILRKSPMIISQELKEAFTCSELLSKVENVGGYLNFFISDSYYTSVMMKEILEKNSDYGKSDIGKGKKVILDYSSPNICKPFHIGHLGSTIIGHSIKKIHEYCSYNCTGINYLGDWGTQFGKQIVAYKKWSSKEQVDKDGVDELVRTYVKFHEEAEKDPTLNDLARQEFHKLETGDEENTKLWKWFVDISLAEFEKSYKKLGVTFDSYKGESFYTDKMPEQVQKLKDMNLLKIDDGASIVDLSEYSMPPCLILKRDGSTLYPTRDIAAAVYRYKTYHFDKAIYVTSNQQCLHFSQWFKVIELMGYDFYDKLVHVPYGTISVDGEKLSTRNGNVVLIRDLIETSVSKVKEIMLEKNPNLENRDIIAEDIGVGAIIFYYLMNDRNKDVKFVLSDALSFEGNSGPYAQYTFARTCQVLSKANNFDDNNFKLTTHTEEALVKTLSLFKEKVLDALSTYEPATITRYILDVCAQFNRFYHECPILNCEDEIVKNTRIALTKCTNIVLGNALPLICMRTPNKI